MIPGQIFHRKYKAWGIKLVKNLLITKDKRHNFILSDESLSILIVYSYVLVFSVVLVFISFILMFILNDVYLNYAIGFFLFGIGINIASFIVYVTVCLPIIWASSN